MKVLRYELPWRDGESITIPEGIRRDRMHLGVKMGQANLWVAHEEPLLHQKPVTTIVTCVYTGKEAPPAHDYIGTAIMDNLVCHYFAIRGRQEEGKA